MKKKIYRIITAPLEWLYLFRIDRMFLLPSECRRLMEAHTAKVKTEFGTIRQQFKEAVLELRQLRTKSTANYYEIKLFVNKAALDSPAGTNAAVADISLAIAQQIVERHNKSKLADKNHPVILDSSFTEIDPENRDFKVYSKKMEYAEALKLFEKLGRGSYFITNDGKSCITKKTELTPEPKGEATLKIYTKK